MHKVQLLTPLVPVTSKIIAWRTREGLVRVDGNTYRLLITLRIQGCQGTDYVVRMINDVGKPVRDLESWGLIRKEILRQAVSETPGMSRAIARV